MIRAFLFLKDEATYLKYITVFFKYNDIVYE